MEDSPPAVPRAPLLPALWALILGLWAALGHGTVAVALLAISLLCHLLARRWKAALLFLAIALLGWGRMRLAGEPPLPRGSTGRFLQFSLQLDRCSLRTYASGRRIYGFGRLVSIGKSSPRLGQQVYYSLALPKDLPMPIRGQRILVRAKLRKTLPKSQAFELYLHETGVHYRVVQGQVLSLGPISPLDRRLAAAHARSVRSLRLGLAENSPARHIYGAMLLGDRSAMTPEEKSTYSRVGIAHLFAVSGLHIGEVAVLIGLLTRGLPLPQPLLVLLRLLPLLGFVLMTGGSPSAFRAFTMVASLWLAPLFFRHGSGLASLTLAALVTLLLSPASLISTSFQFSYGVVLSLLLFGAPLGSWFRQRLTARRRSSLLRRGAVRLGQLIALSIAATLPLIPLSLFHFQTFSIGGIFLNPCVIPLSTVAIFFGFCSLCLGFLGIFPGCWLCNVAALPFLRLIHALADGTGQLRWVTSPPLSIGADGTFLWFTAIAAALFLGRRWKNPLLRFGLPSSVAALPFCWLSLFR
ncbi:MAG: ComEC/Rec2 family competence protein [Puniceicoccales bacterium]|jgi:competence protein ComEC|nr:ComEC/Rec2 family competence protein [Puniceicoccales bacterium]